MTRCSVAVADPGGPARGHQLDGGLRVEVGGGADRGQLAEVQHRDPVGDLEHVAEVVRDHQDGRAAAGQLLDQAEHELGLGDAERGGGLVHDDHLSLLHDGLSHGHRLALPAGQRADHLADRLDRGDPQVGQGLLGGQFHVDLVQQAQPDLFMAEHHVGHDVQVVGQGQVLVDGRDAKGRGVPGAVQVDLVALPEDLAGARLPDPRDGLDQGRLARPVVPDQRGDLAGRDVEADVSERLHRAEVLPDATQAAAAARTGLARCRTAPGPLTRAGRCHRRWLSPLKGSSCGTRAH